MKKFISFVMAAAMVASLVPATAFAAAGDDVAATARVVGSWTELKDSDKLPEIEAGKMPEVQLKVTKADQERTTDKLPTAKVRLLLDNADFVTSTFHTKATLEDVTGTGGTYNGYFAKGITVRDSEGNSILTTSDNVTADTPDTTTDSWTATPSDETTIKQYVKDYVEGKNDGKGYFLADSTAITNPSSSSIGAAHGQTIATLVGSAGAQKYDVAAMALLAAAAVDGGTVLPLTADTGFDASLVTATEAATATMAKQGGQYVITVADSVGKSAKIGLNDAGIDIEDHPNTGYLAALQTEIWGLETGNDRFYSERKTSTTTPGSSGSVSGSDRIYIKEIELKDSDEVEITFGGYFEVGDIISIDLISKQDKQGKDAKVSVAGDFVNSDDLVYVAIESRGITATTRKTTTVAEEEYVTLNSNIVVKSVVDDFVQNQWFELKLSKGFEFTNKTQAHSGADYRLVDVDGNTVYMQYTGTGDEITIDKDDLEIEATSAKSGAVCTLTVKAWNKDWDGKDFVTSTNPNKDKLFNATATVEIMKVVDYKVELSVDEDEDMPVIYSGVNADNYGITDDSDHWSMEVTAEETFPGAWSFRKGFNFELPEGVYVTDVKVINTDAFLVTNTSDDRAENDSREADDDEVFKAFFDAYQDGSHVNFEFKKRVFDDVDTILSKDVASMTFQLQLVADPGFEGDVILKLTGELVDDQEVAIAKFVKPYEVKAEQNDIIIDYRYTDIPTAITITEAEKGLWAKNEATFRFKIENGEKNFFAFEGDPTFEIDSKSDIELKTAEAKDGEVHFTVKTESDEAATITIKDMQMFMNRSIPAGPYDLEIGSSLADAYDRQILFAADHQTCDTDANVTPDPLSATHNGGYDSDEHDRTDKDCWVGDIADYSTTVKEAFINVVTAGRDQDDASFTTKVVVPVGENYIVAGEKQIELDTPAYINAAGYTMLPIRAVAVALGINSNNVLWDQPTKTVTILYGQRIITMTQGQKVVYVNGSAIPASAAVENTNSRTFLPMRDLATALGVTDITWDQATRTATLNGNQK